MRNINLSNKTILVTGAAGFIGANLVLRLLTMKEDIHVIGIDNMNDYYDVKLKEWRLEQIKKLVKRRENNRDKKTDKCWSFIQGDIADKETVTNLFEQYQPDIVVNLAAQAGVRYSITNPDAYIQSNLLGFYHILEACRHSYSNKGKKENSSEGEKGNSNKEKKENQEHGVKHLVYASSSSVYGGNEKIPFSTEDMVDHPVSLYAATKKSNELMAHAYAKLYNIPSTGLRFFTVYGPAGRPDMAYFGFTDKLRRGEDIQLFNYGNCRRDFTYVDDIVEGVIRIMQGAPEQKDGPDGLPLPPYSVYNIGGGRPENLLDFVQILSEELIQAEVLPGDYNFEAHKKLVPMQPGDVPVTYADTTALERDFGYRPTTDLRTGLKKFARWYKKYYVNTLLIK